MSRSIATLEPTTPVTDAHDRGGWRALELSITVRHGPTRTSFEISAPLRVGGQAPSAADLRVRCLPDLLARDQLPTREILRELGPEAIRVGKEMLEVLGCVFRPD